MAQYTQGAYVLAALDRQIRLRTVGLRSLEDVFGRLNDRRNLTAASFEAAVVSTAGSGMRSWLDRYVAGTALPPPPAAPLACQSSPALGPLQVAVLLLFGGLGAVFLGLVLANLVLGDRRRS